MKINTNIFKIPFLLISLLIFSVPLMGQGTVIVREILSPDNIVIFYVGDFGVTDASSSAPIFEYELSATEYPQSVRITFSMNATVPFLDLNNTEIIFAQTSEFEINGFIRISNTQLVDDINRITDSSGEEVTFSVPVQRNIGDADPAKRDALIEAVTRSGKLPAGAYSFTFLVESSTALNVDNPFESKIIDITNPTTLDLIWPGASLAEDFEIFTTFPRFEWESEGCEYGIRVSLYNPVNHSSLQEALNDDAYLPFGGDGYYVGDDPTSKILLYPSSADAKQLEFGKTYVWSVKKTCLTTGGDEERNSDILVFKIADLTGEGDDTGVGGIITDPVIAALQLILGETAFDAYFSGNGELVGYTTVTSILLNGATADVEAVNDLVKKMDSGEVTAIRIEIP